MSHKKSVEVINLDGSNPGLICDNLPELPIGIQGATGQLVQGEIPIICGNEVFSRTDGSCDCFSLKDGQWHSISDLTECRRYPTSTTLFLEHNEEVLLIMGGRHGSTNVLTIESLNGSQWVQGRFSKMLNPVWEHCLAKINSSTLLSIGGMDGGSVYNAVPNTFFFNGQDNKWTEGPTLKNARTGLSCGVLNWNNPETNQMEKVVVAAGGYSTDTVELLFLDGNKNTGSWISGPSLPEAAWLSTMIEFQNSVILIGGELGVDGRHLYQLSSPSGAWVEMKQTLKEPRVGHMSFLVPDELVNCH